MSRCAWSLGDPLLREYHDTEWGVPAHNDRRLFEYLLLDAAQAGLSWLTVLRKREGYRALFADYDAARVAAFTSEDVARILADPRIVRNRAKVASAVTNAARFVETQAEFGSFDRYIWQFVGGRTVRNAWRADGELPPQSEASQAMSRDLIRRGFRFVGPTICYAFMQAAGLVNDHITTCFRYGEV
jgi:DNA-3-methyladenine glycosylase I